MSKVKFQKLKREYEDKFDINFPYMGNLSGEYYYTDSFVTLLQRSIDKNDKDLILPPLPTTPEEMSVVY